MQLKISLLFIIVVGLLLGISEAKASATNGKDHLNYNNASNARTIDFDSDDLTRIVSGRPIKIRQVPWQVALLYYGQPYCGASLISKDWVLTAAHCVDGGGEFSVRAGSQFVHKGGHVRKADKVIISTGYNRNTLSHDIAMVKTDRPFSITKFVRPILLAKTGRELPQRYYVTGWGALQEGGSTPQHLQGVTVKRVNIQKCRDQYAQAHMLPITKYMICAAWPDKERDSCQGDSGGPLTRNNIQYGIVSFGNGCARPNYPGVYTKIPAVNKWIKYVVKRWGGAMPTFA